jgi:predicted RNA-binding Zn-ribbon protein involved in translation (DUF1610 family)
VGLEELFRAKWMSLTPAPTGSTMETGIPVMGVFPSMNAIKAFCPTCGVVERTIAQQIGGKITFGLAGAALGTRAVKDPMVSLICALAGLAVGHYIDQQVSRTCPQCGTLLQIAGWLP